MKKQATKSVVSKEQQQGHQGSTLSSWQACQHHSKNVCRLGFLALYCILYMTLSSNPKLMDSRNDHSMDLPSVEQLQRVRQSHIQKASSMIARKFTPVSPSQWCLSNEYRFEQAKREPMGLCYLNIPETKSDVVQGITERIAQNFLQRHEPGTPSSCIRHHGPIPGTYYKRREKQRSFLFTLVRDPTERAMARVASTMLKQRGKRSSFFILPQASGNATNGNTTNGNTTNTDSEQPTEEDLLSQQVLGILQSSTDVHYGTVSEGRGGFQLQYAMLHIIPEYSAWNASQPDVVQKPEDVQRRVQRILEGYNFIGVVERLDESLVALQLLLGLETQDMLYFASQLTPKYHRRVVPGSSGKHHYCQEQLKDGKNWLWTPSVEEYLHSTTWWAQNYGDLLLHEAASQSLDRTIHNEIGWKQFSSALRDFHRWMDKAKEECHPVYPCSANGTDQFIESEKNCYANHLACGYPCLDDLLKKKEKTEEATTPTYETYETDPTDPTESNSDTGSPTGSTVNGTSTDSSTKSGTNKKIKKTKQQKASPTTTSSGASAASSTSNSTTPFGTTDGFSTSSSNTDLDPSGYGSASSPTTNDDTDTFSTGTTTGGTTGVTTSTGKKKKSTSTPGASTSTTTTTSTGSGSGSGTSTTFTTPKKKSTGKRKNTATATTSGGNPSW